MAYMAKRTTHKSPKGTKLYAVREKSGKFKDVQSYKRKHGVWLAKNVGDGGLAKTPKAFRAMDAAEAALSRKTMDDPLSLTFEAPKTRLPTDKQARKETPIASGCLDYFPDACAAVANLSWVGNEQHNPGQQMHWARGKSTDEADCLIRHFMERGTDDTDGIPHTVKVAWRALAMLQKELEERHNLPISRGSRSS